VEPKKEAEPEQKSSIATEAKQQAEKLLAEMQKLHLPKISMSGHDWHHDLQALQHWFLGQSAPWPEKWPERVLAFFSRITRRGWVTLAGSLFAAALLVGVIVAGSWSEPVVQQRASYNADTAIYYQLKPGLSAREIADELVAKGVLRSKADFWWQARMKGKAADFMTGTYALKPNMSADEVIALFTSGDTTRVKFTIPEGFGVKEIAKRLADEGIVDEQEFLAKAKHFAPYDYIEKKGEARYYAEGFLFPDTYTLDSDIDADHILKMMARDFDQRLTPELRSRAEEMHLSIFDLVTLASLVEKECRYPEDRAIVAQVFFKRLKVGMPLQTDTTLQYLMAGPKEDVSLEDTKIDSPYNTYQHDGLPPGPIASPGMASIKAVLYPADTDYLYFVADRQGHNHYATNYQDHMANVHQYR